MDKNIGKKLDGRYEVNESIGVGGMAEVYKGIDLVENKTVAIKILKREFAENEEFLRRFRNEAKAISVLSHPNIVRIFDVGYAEKIQYIVMEYIDGITLKEYIEEEKVLSWKETVHFVVQILRALQHAHSRGIVHRDIKPQNIMVLADGTVKVMDFGIAKFAREEVKTSTDQAIGSVHYISPEQAGGEVTDERSDIYSVGAMMYEMLTGKKVFDSDNPVAIAVMHMHDTPERPRAINPDIPDGLEEIVLKTIEKKPEDRYQTTAEMIEDIDRFKENPDINFGYYQEADEDSESTRYFSKPNEKPVQENQYQPVYTSVANSEESYSQRPVQPQPQPQPEQYGNHSNEEYYNDDDDDDDEDDDDDRPSLLVPVLTAIVVVVIIVAVIFIATILGGFIQDHKSEKNDYLMPDVVGMDYNDAVKQYGNNIQFQEDGSEYNEQEAGVIIWQSIEANTEFKRGDVLKVKISKGMETVEVPHCADMNQELAKDLLRQKGLECEIKNSSSTDVEKGYVIKSEPDEGTEVHKGTIVVLYVSMGVDAGQVSVDDFTGYSAEDAATRAEYKGLKPVIEPVASYEEEGKVVEQSIAKGEKVELGSEIVFKVSNGQNPDGEIPFTVNFPSDANGRFVIDFMLTKEDGTTTSDSTTIILVPEMSSITQTVKGSGEKVDVTVTLTNMTTNVRATIGKYIFNFATSEITVESEDVWTAFDQVGGFPPATEPPTEAPTEAPYVEPEPYVDPYYVEPTQPPATEYVPPVVETPTETTVHIDNDYDGYDDITSEWIGF